MSIRERRDAIYVQITDAETRHKDEIRDLYKRLNDLSKECEHNWEYYPDPSGNNDSCYICNECSKEVKRKP